VQAHYDLPGAVFEAMLDETMAYSCAVFERPGMSLGDAQRARFDRICRKLRLGADDHLLEIGTGWGGLALHAAERYGCRVTTTTISDAQREVAAARVAAAGLGDRVTVLGLAYRDLEGCYERLVSVEMIEAVDWRPRRVLRSLLQPAGSRRSHGSPGDHHRGRGLRTGQVPRRLHPAHDLSGGMHPIGRSNRPERRASD
jgi:cyclopropane fatty-acyl-phospholipid synthase-like methyltransferase